MEALQQLAGLDVPQGARRIAAAGQNLLVGVGERAARHVAGVRADRFLAQRHLLVGAHRIDGDLVVQAAARHQIAGRCVRARHNPCGRHRYGVLAIGGERIPDAQFAVLRGADDVPLVRRPVAAQHLGRVALEDAARLDVDEGDHLDALGGRGHCVGEMTTPKE